MARVLDGPALRETMSRYAALLREHREELDSLNVFPVPDGDTGTNLLMTQQAVVDALRVVAERDLAAVGAEMSRAALMGARGTSGVILSQVLRGLAEGVTDAPAADATSLAKGLRRAADESWRAVAEPVEGTMLTILRDAAAAGEDRASEGADVAEIADAALEEATRSLDRTPELLPELARAGVVDAGAKGVVLLLDALASVLRGSPTRVEVGPLGPVGRGLDAQLAEATSAFGHEVMYLLECSDDQVPGLRDRLGELGDSLVVVGGGGLYTVHVHTDSPQRAVEEGQRAGATREVRVTSLDEQVAERCLAGEARAVRLAGEVTEQRSCAMVAVAPGAGVAKLFRSLGAEVVDGGPGRLPSVEELVRAIERAGSDSVLLLPNHRNVQPAAAQAAEAASGRVEVIATRSVPAGIAAAAAFNPDAALDENIAEATEAHSRVVAAEVAVAVRDADTPAGSVRAGDALGVVEGEVRSVGGDPVEVLVEVVRPLVLDEHEVLTLVVGSDVSAEDEERGTTALRDAFPSLEVEVHRGEQPHYPFLVGVE